MGKVYLVGAGCGALDLYTLKAIQCIENADCLVYDALVDNRILEKCKKDCEQIYVGKQMNNHAMKQEDICALLVEKSKEHEVTVRLKGGDVYVFGRGGEEGQVLFESSVDFEVVPGLSSVTAGLAYAGVPITHRGLSGGFQVYTGYLKEGEDRKFDYSKMLDDYCTYVFLMSMSKLESIATGFMNAGKKKETPVAVISHASMPTQRTLVSTLENVVEDFKNDPLKNPGIIVVGDVVKMREYLNFYEKKPLFSKSCLVTSVGNDHYLKTKLDDLGANAYEYVTGEIAYLDTILPEISGYLVFTSVHGVNGFMKNYLKQYKDVRSLYGVKIVCIGEKTNNALNEYGLDADIIPSQADSDVLNKELAPLFKDNKVYLVKGENKTNIQNYTDEIVVYRNSEVKMNDECREYDYGFFTCASSVKRFSKMNKSTCRTYVSIGAHTTNALKECYGDVKIIETSIALKDEMIKEVLEDLYV